MNFYESNIAVNFPTDEHQDTSLEKQCLAHDLLNIIKEAVITNYGVDLSVELYPGILAELTEKLMTGDQEEGENSLCVFNALSYDLFGRRFQNNVELVDKIMNNRKRDPYE